MLSRISEFLNNTVPKQEQWLQLLQDHQDVLGDLIIEDVRELLNAYRHLEKSLCSIRLLENTLIDLAWEQMHKGHWKDVSLSWRILYSCIKLLKVIGCIRSLSFKNSDNLCPAELIPLIHDLDYSLIMGCPILDGLACKLASELHQVIEPSQTDLPTVPEIKPCFSLHIEDFCNPQRPLHVLPHIECPSLEKFSELLLDGLPFVISGATTFWPACQLTSQNHWTLDYWLRKFGFRLVPIETGSKYTEESWGQEFMPLHEFIHQYVLANQTSGTKGYLAQHQLFLQIPELMDDLFIPDYCFVHGQSDDETRVDSNIWFGPHNTVSPLHHDSDRANLLTQIQGWKYVILYPASETEYLYPYSDNMLHNTSELDAENPDLGKYPEFVKAQGYHGILGPGEMLYIPPRCWHYVRALSISFSVNFWWDVVPSLVPCWPKSYAVVRA